VNEAVGGKAAMLYLATDSNLHYHLAGSIRLPEAGGSDRYPLLVARPASRSRRPSLLGSVLVPCDGEGA